MLLVCQIFNRGLTALCIKNNNLPKVAHWNTNILLAFKMSRQHSEIIDLKFKFAFHFFI